MVLLTTFLPFPNLLQKNGMYLYLINDFFTYFRKTIILHKTDYCLYTALIVKSPSFLEEKFPVVG